MLSGGWYNCWAATLRHVSLLAAALLVLALAATPSRAQEAAPSAAAPSSQDLGEVIVTATRRSESVQAVPESITVLGNDILTQRGVDTFIDYAMSVPNLSFGATGEGSLANRSIALRGVAGAGLEGGGTTGFYIDETPADDSLDPRVIDLDRIEVLRGPQGTLYGARSMGGTVRLITNQPDFSGYSSQLHADVSGTDHGNEANYAVDGVFNAPLNDQMAMRALGFFQSDAGVFDKAVGPLSGPPLETIHGIGSDTAVGAQIALRYRPLDNLTITPRVLFQEIDEDHGFPFADLAPGNFVQRRSFNLDERAEDRWFLDSLTADYDAGFGTFTWATSYIDRDTPETEDDSLLMQETFNLSPALPVTITRDLIFKRFSQELRFVSQFSDRFHMVSGLFYSDTHNSDNFPPNIIPGINALTGGVFGTDLFYEKNRTIITTEYAAYTEGSYEVVEHLQATVGVRVFHNAVSMNDTTEGIAAGGTVPVHITGNTPQSGSTPKFMLEYQVSPSVMTYASASKGYRIGGVNSIPPAALLPSSPLGCSTELAAIGATPANVEKYNSDTLWSYEGGVKSTLGGTTTLNADYFYIDWSNIQQTESLACGFSFTGNAGAAVSKGTEIELTTRPVAGLLVTLGAGYTDARITKVGAITLLPVGSPIFQVPQWTATGTAEYSFPLGSNTGFVLGDFGYTGSSLSGNNNPLVPRLRPAYTLADARAGIRIGTYEVAVYGKNLTNDIANLSDNASIAAEAPGLPRYVVARPRTIGLDVRLKF
jgi:iron complex outermembrane recepter protein